MAAFDKKKLAREIERDRRQRLAVRLAELRELIKVARAHRREAVQGVRLQCRLAREKLRSNCARRAEQAKERAANRISAHAAEVKDARETDRLVRTGDRRHRLGVVKARASSSERRQESDDEVRANIPANLRDVFDKVRRHVKGSARKSRTEAFLEWVEENPSEVYSYQALHAERELAALIAEHTRTERAARRKRVSLADVPF